MNIITPGEVKNDDIQIHIPTSPEIQMRELNIERHKMEFEENNVYSCCFSKNGTTDRRVLEYCSKTAISFSILAFSFIMIARNKDPCSPLLTFYSSLVTLILGSYIKTPSVQAKSFKRNST